jgi:hypothetical protein
MQATETWKNHAPPLCLHAEDSWRSTTSILADGGYNMKNDPPTIIGQPCQHLYRNMVRLLAKTDPRLLPLEYTLWRNDQAKEGRANRITGMIRRLRRPF